MAKPDKNALEIESLQKKLRLSTIIIVLLAIALCAVTVVLNNRASQQPQLPAPEEAIEITAPEETAELPAAEEPLALPAPEEPLALPPGKTAEERAAEILTYWTDEAKLKTELPAYMNAITDPSSPDFIPIDDRIAVFDMDGTILCETDPVYFDHMLLLYRVTEDPEYKDKASEFEKSVAADIQSWIDTGKSPADMMVRHGQGVASAFKGFTVDEFYEYVDKFKAMPMRSYDGMTNGESFYKPMLQLIDYLKAYNFTVYIISGTDRLITRAAVNGAVDLPPRQIIGSDERIVATGQGETDALDYTLKDDDALVLAGEFIVKDLKMNKVNAMIREIGTQPVLAFGNTSSDFAMAKYVTANNKYKTLGYMVCCDDLERENGNLEKAEKMVKDCEENGWTPISMKNDWTTIYGEGVTYNKSK